MEMTMNAYVTGFAARQTPVFAAPDPETAPERPLSRAEAYVRAHRFERPTLVIDTQ
ncbi:type III PLP-dependent enzyme, partial [Salipiger sp. HF18]|nr:type III PLP-dependent enzyme [Salipiger sp. HF18]